MGVGVGWGLGVEVTSCVSVVRCEMDDGAPRVGVVSCEMGMVFVEEDVRLCMLGWRLLRVMDVAGWVPGVQVGSVGSLVCGIDTDWIRLHDGIHSVIFICIYTCHPLSRDLSVWRCAGVVHVGGGWCRVSEASAAGHERHAFTCLRRVTCLSLEGLAHHSTSTETRQNGGG